MGKVERRSKAPSGFSSPSPENDKNELREALSALKRGPQENGVEFSGLGDSEMNGVSSLLKMRESGRRLMFPCGGESGGSFGVGTEGGREDLKRIEDEDDGYGEIVAIDVPIAEASESKELAVDDLGDDGYGFSVGDFVWGKIKSHPWWPGRIYDPCEASDFALKMRQKNRLLVAYFGDGTFAWCRPSQLKPFEVNFPDMARVSSSGAFVNAVQEAVNEVGRLLVSKMSYSGVEVPLAKNSGIKEGVIVPETGIERFSGSLIDPAELLSRVKQIAGIISIASILELEILKARLSAFYLSRGGYTLPNYELPQPVPGLEDRTRDERVDAGNGKGAVEAPVQGPFEEDYYTLPASPKSGELSHSQEISGNRSNHRIKRKSIAEIMEEEDKDISTRSKEGDTTEKVKKKREGIEDATASKPLQKRKGLLLSASAGNDGGGGKVGGVKGTSSRSKEKKGSLGNENPIGGSKKETGELNEKGFLSRERKKSMYLSSPFITPVRGQRNGDVETESIDVSSDARLSEPMGRAADHFPKSHEPLDLNDEAIQENSKGQLTTAQDYPNSSNHRTPEDDANKVIIDPAKVEAVPAEVLSSVRYAAINPRICTVTDSLENFVDFMSVLRSSLYRRGSYYSVYKKHQPGRKRKKPESEVGMPRKVQKQTDHISPTNESESRKRRKKETSSGMPKSKQAAKDKAGNRRDENVSAAALLVSFGRGSSLPLKSDLITMYSKFGALNESETAMSSSNYSARVCFLKDTDAEKALKHSQNTSPFGSPKVSFRLQYLSGGSKSGDNGEKSKSKTSAAKKEDKTRRAKPFASLLPGNNEASKLNYIKQKLEDLNLMLEATDSKSPDRKIKLESGMKRLLEDVNKMVESSSS